MRIRRVGCALPAGTLGVGRRRCYYCRASSWSGGGLLCIVHFGGLAPVGGPLRGNRRVSWWLPEAVVCFGGPPASMGLTHTRPAAPIGVLSPAAVPGGSQTQNRKNGGNDCHSTATLLPPDLHPIATPLPPDCHPTASPLPPHCHSTATQLQPHCHPTVKFKHARQEATLPQATVLPCQAT